MSSEWKPGDVIPERYSGMPVTFKWNEGALTAMLGALRDGYEAGYHSMVGHIQDAMRDFTPPRPDEPTGLGAVVFASCYCRSDRQRFTRAITDDHQDAPWKSECGHHLWRELDLRDADDVLSEGVQS